MRVFVTGGSGFVGGHVIEALVREGHEVRAMARSESSASRVAELGAEASRSSLDDVAPEHLDGCDAVVHCAAYVEEWGTREVFWRINVEGTSRLLEASKVAGVARFIFVGTEAALFDGHDLIGIDETTPYPERQRFLYSETKAEAERRVLAASDDGFTALSIRPRFVWGPRDQSVLPAIRRMVEAGSYSWIDGGRARTSTTYVGNLVHAILLALSRGNGGEAYFVADEEETTLRDFIERLAATEDLVLPSRSVPSWLARASAGAAELVWRAVRPKSTPPLTRFAAAMMSSSVTVDTSKAKRDLGYAPVVSVAEGLAAMRAHGA